MNDIRTNDSNDEARNGHLSFDTLPARYVADMQAVNRYSSERLREAIVLANQVIHDLGATSVEVLTGGCMSLAIRADVEGADSVIKLQLDSEVGSHEIAALAAWQPTGIPPMLHRHLGGGSFVMEFIRSNGLRVNPERAFNAASKLHSVSPPRDIPPLSFTIDERFERVLSRVSSDDFETVDALAQARVLADDLLKDSPSVLLHGDLHEGNIMDDGRAIRIIDPAPRLGDPLYDLAMFAVARELSMPEMTAEPYLELVADPDRLRDWMSVVLALERRFWPAERGEMWGRYVAELRGA